MTPPPSPTTLSPTTLVADVPEVSPTAAAEAERRHAQLATPPGSLGRVERLGAQLAAIAGRCPPPCPQRPSLVVAAADHGVHAQGVSPWPQSVTSLMVRTLCEGGAAANAFAEGVGADVTVLDVGVAHPVADAPALRRSTVRAGTRDLAHEPAMRAAECEQAVGAGATAAAELIADGADLLVTGDMGIANTTAAAALIAAFTGRPAGEVTGPGTGIDDATREHKTTVVADAVHRHRDDDAWGRLAGLGGLEHAALVGLLLSSAAHRVPVLLDGVNATAAAVAAQALAPALSGHLLAGHRSTEPGASAALEHLGLDPLLDLELRLGEGTGALLAVPIVRAAAATLSQVALLDDVVHR